MCFWIKLGSETGHLGHWLLTGYFGLLCSHIAKRNQVSFNTFQRLLQIKICVLCKQQPALFTCLWKYKTGATFTASVTKTRDSMRICFSQKKNRNVHKCCACCHAEISENHLGKETLGPSQNERPNRWILYHSCCLVVPVVTLVVNRASVWEYWTRPTTNQKKRKKTSKESLGVMFLQRFVEVYV